MIECVNPTTFMNNIESLGWKKFPRKRTDIAIYQYDNGENFLQIVIPLDKTLFDYDEAMLNALKTISDFKRADLASIIEEYRI